MKIIMKYLGNKNKKRTNKLLRQKHVKIGRSLQIYKA